MGFSMFIIDNLEASNAASSCVGTIPTACAGILQMQVRAGCVLGLNCATGVIPLPEASLFMQHVF